MLDRQQIIQSIFGLARMRGGAFREDTFVRRVALCREGERGQPAHVSNTHLFPPVVAVRPWHA